MKAKLPTIKDIAAKAGVNHCVVSHVLHNDAYAAKVRPDTRERILAISKEMGYLRNSMASAIRTGQVNTIAVIMNFKRMLNVASSNQLMIGIMMETSLRHLSVKIFSEDDLENAFRTIMENRIGKVISLSVDAAIRERTAEIAENNSLDLVFCYEHGHGRFPTVNIDNAGITADAVHYFAGRGHSRIGLLCVPHGNYHVFQERHEGYLRGMAECGLEVDPRWVCCSGETEKSIDSMLALPKKQRPTAFIALADVVAARAQRYAWEKGLRIPEEFSVTGIGDTECSEYAMVPITTFREILPESGRLLVRLVLGEKIGIESDEFNVYRTHAEMIERKSVFNLNKNRRSK